MNTLRLEPNFFKHCSGLAGKLPFLISDKSNCEGMADFQSWDCVTSHLRVGVRLNEPDIMIYLQQL